MLMIDTMVLHWVVYIFNSQHHSPLGYSTCTIDFISTLQVCGLWQPCSQEHHLLSLRALCAIPVCPVNIGCPDTEGICKWLNWISKTEMTSVMTSRDCAGMTACHVMWERERSVDVCDIMMNHSEQIEWPESDRWSKPDQERFWCYRLQFYATSNFSMSIALAGSSLKPSQSPWGSKIWEAQKHDNKSVATWQSMVKDI